MGIVIELSDDSERPAPRFPFSKPPLSPLTSSQGIRMLSAAAPVPTETPVTKTKSWIPFQRSPPCPLPQPCGKPTDQSPDDRPMAPNRKGYGARRWLGTHDTRSKTLVRSFSKKAQRVKNRKNGKSPKPNAKPTRGRSSAKLQMNTGRMCGRKVGRSEADGWRKAA